MSCLVPRDWDFSKPMITVEWDEGDIKRLAELVLEELERRRFPGNVDLRRRL